MALTVLYQRMGHFPNVRNDTSEWTAVLAFILMGVNLARLLVPLGLGAVLALAPWVDENIINRREEGASGDKQ